MKRVRITPIEMNEQERRGEQLWNQLLEKHGMDGFGKDDLTTQQIHLLIARYQYKMKVERQRTSQLISNNGGNVVNKRGNRSRAIAASCNRYTLNEFYANQLKRWLRDE